MLLAGLAPPEEPELPELAGDAELVLLELLEVELEEFEPHAASARAAITNTPGAKRRIRFFIGRFLSW
jgi:hypothetical protein